MAPRMTNCGERTFIRADRARGVGSAAPCQESQGVQGVQGVQGIQVIQVIQVIPANITM